MAVMTSFFQVFILLGMYNFAGNLDLKLIFSYDGAHVKKLRAVVKNSSLKCCFWPSNREYVPRMKGTQGYLISLGLFSYKAENF